MEKFKKGDLVLFKWSREMCGKQKFYLVTRENKANHGTEFIQIRRATKGGKLDERFSNYSHTGLAKNFELVKRADEIAKTQIRSLKSKIN